MGRTQVPSLFTLALTIILLLAFTGCGSVSGSGSGKTNNPSPTPTPPASPTPSPTPTPALASRFIYGTPGFETGTIQAGIIQSNGSVVPVAGSPFDEGLGTPDVIQIVGDVKGRFVYVLNVDATAVEMTIGEPGIAGFKIDRQTGALTSVPGSPITFPQRNNNFMVMDGTGHFLFEPNGLGDSASTGFDVYAIDQNTGTLTKTTSTSNAPPLGNFAAASADGQFVFNAGNGLVEAFSIVSSTGQLLADGAPISTGGSAGPIAASSDGKFLYVANANEGTVAVFAVGAGGALSMVSGSPFAIDPGAESLELTPDGKFLYVAAFTDTATSANQTVKGYAVNPGAGTFTPIPGAIVNNVDSVTIDFSGKFAYISSPGSLFTYSIDPTTGALTQLSHTTAPSSDDASDLVTVP
ncbi:MAG TPA: beta-propeller fold lactonase family protein [Candidatus Angelobacter sp.]|nr:beta-propeller fold lactonase family protein [Candidatus Angelobacter sp.]